MTDLAEELEVHGQLANGGSTSDNHHGIEGRMALRGRVLPLRKSENCRSVDFLVYVR